MSTSPTTNTMDSWVDNFPDRVQVQPGENKETMLNGSYLSGESALIVSGPPTLDSDLANLIPIGLTQQAQLSQNKDLNQIFEIGGRVPFFIPGRTQIRASLSRVLFHGPSLMYALYRQKGPSPEIPSIDSFGGNLNKPHSLPTNPYPLGGVNGLVPTDNRLESKDSKPSHF